MCALEKANAFHQTFAHANLVMLEVIANTNIALEFFRTKLLFVPLLVLVFHQAIAFATVVTHTKNANTSCALELLQTKPTFALVEVLVEV